jgi:hypothetical protein
VDGQTLFNPNAKQAFRIATSAFRTSPQGAYPHAPCILQAPHTRVKNAGQATDAMKTPWLVSSISCVPKSFRVGRSPPSVTRFNPMPNRSIERH